MTKKARVRTLIDRELVKWYKTLHKSARQYFCHIFWSHWKKLSSETSVLVVSEILRQFFNILAPNDNHSPSVKGVFNATNSNAIITKSKKIFSIFFFISGIYLTFWTLWKKRWTSEVVSVIIHCKKPGDLNA